MKIMEKVREFFRAIEENKVLKQELKNWEDEARILEEEVTELSEANISLVEEAQRLRRQNEWLGLRFIEMMKAKEKSDDEYMIIHFEKSEMADAIEALKFEVDSAKSVAFAYRVQAESLGREINELLDSKEQLIEELEALEDRVGDLEKLCELKDGEIERLSSENGKLQRMLRELQEQKDYSVNTDKE